MSRRFGRNQRRALLAQVAGLRDAFSAALDVEAHEYRRANAAEAVSKARKIMHEQALEEIKRLTGVKWRAPGDNDFILPESAVLSFSDETTGGGHERFERRASVTVFADDGLYQRVIEADRARLRVAFRGIGWVLHSMSAPGSYQPGAKIGDPLRITLALVATA